MPLRAANARSFNRGGAARNRPYSPLLTKLSVDAGAAFSVRKLSAGYFGPCKNVRRSSDNAQADIWFVRGQLDRGAFGAFIGAGGSGFCAKDYDQSGNGRDASQSTAASQPQLVLNQIGARAALQFSGAQYLQTASFASSTILQSFAAVGERTGTPTNQVVVITGGANGLAFQFTNSANTGLAGGALSGSITATLADNAAHSLIVNQNGASSSLVVDGISTAGTLTGQSASGVITIGAGNTGGTALTGDFSELIITVAASFSATQDDTIHTNQSAYYGTP